MRQNLTMQVVLVSSWKSLELQHHRLGHPSENVVKLFLFFSNSIDHLDKEYDEVLFPQLI